MCSAPECAPGQSRNQTVGSKTQGACVAPYAPSNYGNSCPKLGDPINPAVGNKFQIETDYSTSGALPLSLIRTYNSGTSAVFTIGVGWQHNYDRYIDVLASGAVEAMRADGKAYTFTATNGIYSAPDTNDTLQPNASTGGWTYTSAQGDVVETYASSGRLITITDRNGLTLTFGYDGYVRLSTVTDSFGHQLSLTYDTNSRIATMTDPAGGHYIYTYDTSNNLSSVTYPDSKTKTYLYENPSLPNVLTGITDENGDPYSVTQYDSQGRATLTEEGPNMASPAGQHTLAYGTNSTSVTDPLGTARTYNFQTILGVVKSTGVSQPGGSGYSASSSAITYDANGNIASRADFNGHKTCYAYDLARNLETARVEGLASSASCPSDPATYTPAANTAERKILTQWDTRFRLPTKVTEAGRETTTVYDSHGNITSRSIKDTASGQTRTWTTTYTYHATVPGVLVQKVEDGPRIDVADLTTTDYYAPDENCTGDPLGCRGQVKQVTNALGHITTYNQYDANGRVLRTTDPNGILVTTFSYSPRGWLLSRTVGSETTSFDYDYVGQLIKFTRPDGSFVSFEYDTAHRLTAIVDQDGNRLTYTLDAMGNRIHEAITMPGNSTVYYAHSRTFDALGRLWQDIGAANQTITYQYDAQGNLKQIDGARTDVADVTQHGYDALDRLTQTLNADGGVVQVKPNALDQTTQVVDPANQATTQTVDAFGDVTRTVSADTGTTNRTYDEAGNLKSETDARGVTVTYTYDALNRLTFKTSSQPGSVNLRYKYDSCRKGSLCSTTKSGVFDLSFGYDIQGRIQYRLQNTPTATGNTNFFYSFLVYDVVGRPSQLTYPNGRSVSSSYDTQGRVSQVSTQPYNSTPVTILASNFVYGYPFAGPQSFSYGDGTSFYLNRPGFRGGHLV
nr:DUF6531 domain-containing protein [Thiobacillus sp.]